MRLARFSALPDQWKVFSETSRWDDQASQHSDRRFTENALVNAAKLDDVYPGWIMRVYYDGTVPSSVMHITGRANPFLDAEWARSTWVPSLSMVK